MPVVSEFCETVAVCGFAECKSSPSTAPKLALETDL